MRQITKHTYDQRAHDQDRSDVVVHNLNFFQKPLKGDTFKNCIILSKMPLDNITFATLYIAGSAYFISVTADKKLIWSDLSAVWRRAYQGAEANIDMRRRLSGPLG